MSTRVQVARSMVWTVLESFGISGLSIIGLIVVAHYISPEEMGVAAMAQSIVQMLNIPVEFFFVDALIRRRNAEQIDFDTAHTVSVFLGLLIALLCWVGAEPVSELLRVPSMAPVLAWMGISVAAMGFGATIIARQRRDMEFRALAVRSFVGRLGGVSIGIAVAVMGGGVWSLVAQQVLMVTLATLMLWLQCKNRPSFRFSFPHFKELAAFGSRTIAVATLSLSVQRAFMLFVGATLSATAAGYLNLAFRIVDILRDIVTNAVVQLALPMFSRHNDDPKTVKKIYITAVAFTCAVTFPMFGGLALCSADLIHIVFGPQWNESVPYVTLLASLTLVHFARLYSNSVLTARGYPHLPLVPDFAALIAVIIGMVTFGYMSLLSAAAVWVLRLAVALPIDLRNIRNVVGISAHEQLQGALIPLAAVCAMAGVLLALQNTLLANVSAIPHLIVSVLIGAAVYAATFWALDRTRIKELWQFAQAGVKRRSEQPQP